MEYILIIFAYFFGAIPFGLVVSKIFQNVDIREHGSGNIGATNIMRKMGARYAVLVLLLDLGKGALVILTANHLETGHTIMLISGFAVVFGHCFPVFLKFKGGKGVATTLGVLMFIPGFIIPLMLIFFVFVIIVALTRYVSLGSLVGAILIPLTFILLVYQNTFNYTIQHIIFGTGIALLIIIRHRENIRKLLAGEESKMGDKRKAS